MLYTDYKIIDFHCHVFPDKIAQKATDHVGNYYGLKMSGNGTAEKLVNDAEAKKLNVEGFLVHSSATKPQQVEAVNTFLAQLVKKYPQFIGFGTVHKDYESIETELKRIKSLGLRGLKLHPDFQGFFIDEEKMLKVYEIAEHMKLPVLFHVGDKNTQNSTPNRLANVIEMFPRLKVIAAHMGGYSVWDEAQKCLYGKNVYFDTSSTVLFLGAQCVGEMIKNHGADKIVFGSDYPIQTTAEAARDIMNIDLSEKQRENIFYNNAAKLLFDV